MSIQPLGPGRYRAQVYRDGKNVSVGQILGAETERYGAAPGSSVFPSKAKAVQARAMARERLRTAVTRGPTVAEWAERWTTDPLYRRPKESTNLHNAERVRRFVEAYGDLRISQIGDEQVAEWLRDGKNRSTVSALRAMFNDAATRDAGRLVKDNPFAGLKLKRSPGNRYIDPPPEEMIWRLIVAARKQAGPGYGAWLQAAAFTGMRPGELDALRWDAVDFDAGRIHVREQFNATTRSFSLPKNGSKRWAILTPPAREALMSVPGESPYCFTTLRGGHWTASARAYHWKAVKAEAGWDRTLYLATRHFAGWYMRNTLKLDAEDVAIALGHRDGGELVRTLYGHLNEEAALERVARAYESMNNVRQLRPVREDGV